MHITFTFWIYFSLEILLSGIGYILNPDFSFVKIAAPYAQVSYIFLTIIIYHLVNNKLWFPLAMVWKHITDDIMPYAGTLRFKTEAAYWDTACK